jgi:protein required for attachment to host cells
MLVAPPKFLGALRHELDKEVEKLVVEELPKDISGFSAREIERYLEKSSR